MVWVAQKTFAFGEIDPRIFAISDATPTKGGCESLTNGIITRFGSARKRYGTRVIGSTYLGHKAALFEYNSDGVNYIVELTANDAALEGDRRVLRVWDVASRSLVPAFVQATSGYDRYDDYRVEHHFTEADLADVQAFQHMGRLFMTHSSHPPLFLDGTTSEVSAVAQATGWRYGSAPDGEPPPMVRGGERGFILEFFANGNNLRSDDRLFRGPETDAQALWRVVGPAKTEDTNPDTVDHGVWVRKTPEHDSFKAPSMAWVTGVVGEACPDYRSNPADFCGPFLEPGPFGPFPESARINYGGGTYAGDSPFLLTEMTFDPRRHIGTMIVPSTGRQYFAIQHPVSQTSAWATKVAAGSLVGTYGGVTGVTKDFGIMSMDYDRYGIPDYDFRWIYPVKADRYDTSLPEGTVDLYMDRVTVPWLPDGFEERFGSDNKGGRVYLNNGVVAITEALGQFDGYAAGVYGYRGIVERPLDHYGHSLWWGHSWSKSSGFPSCGTSHQQRVFFGGLKNLPSTIVASKTGDADEWVAGPDEDDPLSFVIDDPRGGEIKWMESAKGLFVGTHNSEFVIGGEPIGPSQIGADRHTGYGGSSVQPLLVGGNVLFVDSDKRGVREMGFVFERDRYKANDLTDIATHLFDGKEIQEIDQFVSPESVVVVLFTDGYVCARSYRPENSVMGWSDWTQPSWPAASGTATQTSKILSLASTRLRTGARDEMWLVREYLDGGATGEGETKRNIEIMSDQYSMDCEVDFGAATESAAAAGTMTAMYANTSPHIVIDGVYVGQYLVDSFGGVSYVTPPVGLVDPPALVSAGRAVSFDLTPILPEFSLPGQGDTSGRVRQISTVTVYVNQSRGGLIGDKAIGGQVIPNTNPCAPVPIMQGWQPVFGVGPFGDRAPMRISQDNPYYFEIGSVNCEVDYGTGLD